MFRIDPQMPAHAYKTYEILAPRPTHFREAACADVDCGHYLNGWTSTIDEATDLGVQQAAYIRHRSGRYFHETRNEAGLTVFTFAPGQDCFRQHAVRLDREEIYVVRGGDHRGNPRGERRVHKAAEHWVEDFGGHLEQLRRAQG